MKHPQLQMWGGGGDASLIAAAAAAAAAGEGEADDTIDASSNSSGRRGNEQFIEQHQQQTDQQKGGGGLKYQASRKEKEMSATQQLQVFWSDKKVVWKRIAFRLEQLDLQAASNPVDALSEMLLMLKASMMDTPMLGILRRFETTFFSLSAEVKKRHKDLALAMQEGGINNNYHHL